MNDEDASGRIGSREFFQKTLDSLVSHVAILDGDGTILAVNAAWDAFARRDGGGRALCGPGANYLRACEEGSGDCVEDARRVARGIREVVAGLRDDFHLEYPSHTPTEKRWYNARVTRFQIAGGFKVVVTHDDITERKLAEIRARRANRRLARQVGTDDLTGIPNRRSFDRAIDRAWRKFERGEAPLSVALLDVDCFKAYNDVEGHLAGDDCLRTVALAIQSSLRWPGSSSYRFGGEEFAAILPGAGDADAREALSGVLDGVRALAIPHPRSSTARGLVTISIGGSTAQPGRDASPVDLLGRADRSLYEAKARGRDRLVALGPLEAAGAR